MRHEQADPPRILRILFLLLLLFFTCLLPVVIAHFEAEPDLQWQTMVQPHWQEDDEPLTLPTDADEPDEPAEQPEPEQSPPPPPDLAAQDTVEWKHIAQPEQSAPGPEPDPARAGQITAVDKNSKSPPRAKNRDEKSTSRKTAPNAAATRKNPLKLKLPENPYHGHPAKWEEAAPLPDLFAPKEKPPSRLQFSGRLITDEKKSRDPAASYLDTVQGAEIGVSVSTP